MNERVDDSSGSDGQIEREAESAFSLFSERDDSNVIAMPVEKHSPIEERKDTDNDYDGQ